VIEVERQCFLMSAEYFGSHNAYFLTNRNRGSAKDTQSDSASLREFAACSLFTE
jgi:hypothetical protein